MHRVTIYPNGVFVNAALDPVRLNGVRDLIREKWVCVEPVEDEVLGYFPTCRNIIFGRKA